MEENEYSVAIYVLPSEEGQPPRALIVAGVIVEPLNDDAVMMVGVDQHLAVWSRDMGTWLIGGTPIIDQELADRITQHAKELGVEW